MPSKKSRQKSVRFNPISGGKLIVVHGGWAAGPVQLPVALVEGKLFVYADLHANGSAFAQLVFGKKRTTATERAKVTVVQHLINLVREACHQAAKQKDGEGAPSSAVVAAADAEAADGEEIDDPMARAESARAMVDSKRESKTEYKKWRNSNRKKGRAQLAIV